MWSSQVRILSQGNIFLEVAEPVLGGHLGPDAVHLCLELGSVLLSLDAGQPLTANLSFVEPFEMADRLALE